MITRSYCAAIRERQHDQVPSEESAMYSVYEGLSAAASVQQAVCLAQLEILRRLERQRTGAAAAGR